MQPIAPPELVFQPILPEVILAGAAILILLADAIRPLRNRAALAFMAMAGGVGAAVATVFLWNFDSAGTPTVLGGMVATDRFSVFFRLVVLASAGVAILLSAHYLQRTHDARGEYYALLLFASSGMTLLTAAADLIVVFLALEVLSLSLYVMVGISR